MRRAILPVIACLLVTVAVLLVVWFVFQGRRQPESPLRVVHHFRDWHFVDKDLFSQDIGIVGVELDVAWDEHLDAVEKVQAEQLPLLRELVKQGVTTIYLEGLTPESINAWHALMQLVRSQIDNELVLKKTRDDALATAVGLTGQNKAEALKVADEANALIRQGRELRLKAGPAVLLDGISVRALEDEKTLDAATPDGKPGRLKIDPGALARRQAAMGKALAGATEREVIVILGASHDLPEILRRAGLTAEVKPVTVPKVRDLMGEKGE